MLIAVSSAGHCIVIYSSGSPSGRARTTPSPGGGFGSPEHCSVLTCCGWAPPPPTAALRGGEERWNTRADTVLQALLEGGIGNDARTPRQAHISMPLQLEESSPSPRPSPPGRGGIFAVPFEGVHHLVC